MQKLQKFEDYVSATLGKYFEFAWHCEVERATEGYTDRERERVLNYWQLSIMSLLTSIVVDWVLLILMCIV